jgi:hypothetical protein
MVEPRERIGCRQFFLVRRDELIANNAQGVPEHPYCWLLATGSILQD